MNKRWYETPGGYFMVPRAMCYDDRLTHPDKCLLISIASFIFKEDSVFPSRERLNSMTGMGSANISRRTKRLVELGWLSKDGVPGGKMTYTLHVPQYALSKGTGKREIIPKHQPPKPDELPEYL
jgi:hypothetical protein